LALVVPAFLARTNTLVVSVGIHDQADERLALEAIIPAMAEAWMMATPWFKKHRIPFDSQNVRFVIESIAKKHKMHHVLAMMRDTP